MTDAELTRIMHERGIRPSLHRLAVLKLIADTRRHPTADEIFSELSPMYPSMSKTTVYNSLHSLESGKIIKEVEIDSGVRHYDLAIQPSHSHFICSRCGRIYDMAMPAGIRDISPEGFEIDDVDVVYKGLCPECKNNQH